VETARGGGRTAPESPVAEISTGKEQKSRRGKELRRLLPPTPARWVILEKSRDLAERGLDRARIPTVLKPIDEREPRFGANAGRGAVRNGTGPHQALPSWRRSIRAHSLRLAKEICGGLRAFRQARRLSPRRPIVSSSSPKGTKNLISPHLLQTCHTAGRFAGLGLGLGPREVTFVSTTPYRARRWVAALYTVPTRPSGTASPPGLQVGRGAVEK
jgi:hypothetical protein